MYFVYMDLSVVLTSSDVPLNTDLWIVDGAIKSTNHSTNTDGNRNQIH